jgi:hypothetical protein
MSRISFRRTERARKGRGAVWTIERDGTEVGRLLDHDGTWLAKLATGKNLWGSYGSYLGARRQVIEHFEQER